MANHPSLTIYDSSVHDVIHVNFEIEKLDDTCRFTEGPVWSTQGFYLFSNIPQNVIYKLAPGNNKEVFIQKSGLTYEQTIELSEQTGSNGLAFDAAGNLLICQHGNGAVARWNGKEAESFISNYQQKRFNSPNDIVAHSGGRIFFSDPPYGLKDQKLQTDKCQPLAGIYCWQNGEITLVSDRYQYPNGVCLSPDGSSLYTCSNKPFENEVLEFDAETLRLKRTVANENGDGIKCDKQGNIYLCTKEGILIIDNRGKRLANIQLETIPANCCWGGNHLTDLFITARQNLFLIKNLQKATA